MYKKYGEIAEREGYPNIAYLFEALHNAEIIHINNHINALGEKFTPSEEWNNNSGSTFENLMNAIAGEEYEYKKMYPHFIKKIRSETGSDYGKVARLSMEWAMKVEKGHAKLLKSAKKALKGESDFKVTEIKLCTVCGNLLCDNDSLDVCPVCGHDHKFYNSVKR